MPYYYGQDYGSLISRYGVGALDLVEMDGLGDYQGISDSLIAAEVVKAKDLVDRAISLAQDAAKMSDDRARMGMLESATMMLSRAIDVCRLANYPEAQYGSVIPGTAPLITQASDAIQSILQSEKLTMDGYASVWGQIKLVLQDISDKLAPLGAALVAGGKKLAQTVADIPQAAFDILKYLPWILGGVVLLSLAPTVTRVFARNPGRRHRSRKSGLKRLLPYALAGAGVYLLASSKKETLIPTMTREQILAQQENLFQPAL